MLDGDPALLPKKGAEPPSPIFGPFLLRPNGSMHQDATWYGGRPHPRGLYVRWGPSPLPKMGRSPLSQISAHVYCRKTAGWIKMPLGTEVGHSDDVVLDRDPAPLPQKRAGPPIFGPWLLWPNGWMDQDGT